MAAATNEVTGQEIEKDKTSTAVTDAGESKETAADGSEIKKWPGWPGDNVFRLVVPVDKVGSIIGKKGELIKKICEETRAKIRVLDGVAGTTDRVVLIFGKEELEAKISPAMDAVIRVFKRVSDFETDGTGSSTITTIRLLVPSTQATHLIGKQGASIKSIQETSGAIIRINTGDKLPHYATAEERIVDIQGESSKVLKALEAVVGHLRIFLVDRGVVPLFEKNSNATHAQVLAQAQALVQAHMSLSEAFNDKTLRINDKAPWTDAKAPWEMNDKAPWGDKSQPSTQTAQHSVGDYSLPLRHESLLLEQEPPLDTQIHRSSLSSLYRSEPSLSGPRSTGLGRSSIGALVTQMTQTMQIPLTYAENIIGVGGTNIAHIRRTSGAVLTVQESGTSRDEITVEIKGTSSQVQIAQDLIQEYIEGHKGSLISGYPSLDTELRSSSYSHLGPPSSLYPPPSQSYLGGGGYSSSGLGGYSGSRF